jgi:hypothetical protein
MRFMILVKASKASEAGVMPPEEIFAAMADYHEQLAKAGVLLDGNGLRPSSKGWRIEYSPGKRRALCGNQGACRRLHDHPGEDQARGHRMGQSLSQSAFGRWLYRNSPAFELEDLGESEAIDRFRDIGVGIGQ